MRAMHPTVQAINRDGAYLGLFAKIQDGEIRVMQKQATFVSHGGVGFIRYVDSRVCTVDPDHPFQCVHRYKKKTVAFERHRRITEQEARRRAKIQAEMQETEASAAEDVSRWERGRTLFVPGLAPKHQVDFSR